AWEAEGGSAGADMKRVELVERVTPAGAKPALLVADGGAPVVVGGDGHLYYALRLLDGGGVAGSITRVAPDGKRTRFAPDVEKTAEKLGIPGLAAGPDGGLYVASPSAGLKGHRGRTLQPTVTPVLVKGCDAAPPAH